MTEVTGAVSKEEALNLPNRVLLKSLLWAERVLDQKSKGIATPWPHPLVKALALVVVGAALFDVTLAYRKVEDLAPRTLSCDNLTSISGRPAGLDLFNIPTVFAGELHGGGGGITLAAGEAAIGNNLVFSNSSGLPITLDNSYLESLTKTSGVKEFYVFLPTTFMAGSSKAEFEANKSHYANKIDDVLAKGGNNNSLAFVRGIPMYDVFTRTLDNNRQIRTLDQLKGLFTQQLTEEWVIERTMGHIGIKPGSSGISEAEKVAIKRARPLIVGSISPDFVTAACATRTPRTG